MTWQVPTNVVPIGRGAGQLGYKFNAGVTIDPSTGALAAPKFNGLTLTPSTGTITVPNATVQTFPGSTGTVVTSASVNAVTNAMAAQMAAVTLKGNPTNATANGSDFTIGGLTNLAAPDAANDCLLIWDHTAGTLKKVTPGAIAISATAGVTTLGGASGVLALSSGLSMVGTTLTNVISAGGGNAWLAAGNFGVGTVTPGVVGNPSTVTVTATSGRGALELQNTSTGTTGTAGSIYGLNGSTRLAQIDFAADGAVNSGRIDFYTNNAGTLSGRSMTMDHPGNVIAYNKFGIGGGTPAISLDVTPSGAAAFNQFASTPLIAQILSGSSGTPITVANSPSVFISRYEAITGGGGDGSTGPTLYVTSSGNSSQQNVAFTAYSYAGSSATADAVAVYGTTIHDGVTPRGAFGGFFAALGRGGGSAALAIETNTGNQNGIDIPYDPTLNAALPVMIGIDLNYQSVTGSHVGGPAILVRSTSNRWDVGLAFPRGDFLRTACIQDDTNAAYLWYAPTGSHVHGLDWSGATFSTDVIKTTGFTLTPNGRLVAGGATDDTGTIVQAKGVVTGGSAVWVGYNSSNTVTSVIRSTGTFESATGAYNTISDIATKKDVRDYRDVLADLMQIRVVEYESTRSSIGRQPGIVANELETVLPDMVGESDDAEYGKLKHVKSSFLVPLLLKGMQEMNARLDRMES